MTPQDIVDALSDYGFTDTTSTRKMEKINATVFDITTREPWPFMEQSLDLNFDGTNAKPSNWPSDFQSVLDIIDLSTGRKLQPLRLQEADVSINLGLTQSGTTPLYYYFLGNELRVAKIPPSGTATHRMRYVRVHPTVLQTDPESAFLIPKQHHEVILLGALVKLYDLEDDTELSVRFEQLYEKKYAEMRGSIWMRQYDRPDHIVITDAYDYDYDFYP